MKRITMLTALLFVVIAASAQVKDSTKKQDTVVIREYQRIDTIKPFNEAVLIYCAPDGNLKHYDFGNVIQIGTVRQEGKLEHWLEGSPSLYYYDKNWKVVPRTIQAFHELKPLPPGGSSPAATAAKKK